MSPQAKTLPGLRSGRDAKARGPFQCSHLDTRAERGFVYGDRHRHVQVVAFAAKHRMRSDLRRHIQVTCRATSDTDVPFAGHPQAIAIGDTRRDPNRDRLTSRLLPGSRARLARSRPLTAGAAAGSATAREHHVTSHGSHCAGALAEMTLPGRRSRAPAAGTVPAVVTSSHRYRTLAAG